MYLYVICMTLIYIYIYIYIYLCVIYAYDISLCYDDLGEVAILHMLAFVNLCLAGAWPINWPAERFAGESAKPAAANEEPRRQRIACCKDQTNRPSRIDPPASCIFMGVRCFLGEIGEVPDVISYWHANPFWHLLPALKSSTGLQAPVPNVTRSKTTLKLEVGACYDCHDLQRDFGIGWCMHSWICNARNGWESGKIRAAEWQGAPRCKLQTRAATMFCNIVLGMLTLLVHDV